MFTIKDTDLIILSKLDDRDLLSTCLVNKDANRLCRDENFWRNRFISRYGEKDFEFMRNKVVSWRKFMLLLIKYLDLGENDWNKAMINAAKDGKMALIDFFILKGAKGWNWGMYGAAAGGHRELVDFFISKGADNWNRGMNGAAKGGHRELVDFFISKGADYWDLGMYFARKGGHKDLVKFFESKLKK